MLERVWRKGDAPTLSVGMEIGKPLCRTVWTFLKKLKTGLWRDSAIPLLGIHPPGENHEPEGYVHPTVHCGTVYNSQDVEATYVSINRRTDKEHVVHLHKGILRGHEKPVTMPLEAAWLGLEMITLNEASHREKEKYHVMSLIRGIYF